MNRVEPITRELAGAEATWAGLAAGGWLVALLVSVVAVCQAARADRLCGRAAETAHELRGPLCAARLALDSLERVLADAPRLAAGIASVDLELRRAGLALEDLGRLGAGGARAPAPRRARAAVAWISTRWRPPRSRPGARWPPRAARRSSCGRREDVHASPAIPGDCIRASGTSSPTRASTAAGRFASRSSATGRRRAWRWPTGGRGRRLRSWNGHVAGRAAAGVPEDRRRSGAMAWPSPLEWPARVAGGFTRGRHRTALS